MRTFALCLVVVISTLLGLRMAKRLRGREQSILCFLSACSHLKDAMLYWGMELPAAWEKTARAAQEPWKGVFLQALEQAQAHELCAYTARLIQKRAKALQLLDEDVQACANFFMGLGMQSADQLQMRFDFIQRTMNMALQQAGENRRGRDKLYRSAGLICGLAIALLLA